MSWSAEMASLRSWVSAKIENYFISSFLWTRTSNASAIGNDDNVSQSDDSSGQRPVTRVEPWGHRGRPPSKVRGLTIRIGSSNALFIGIGPTQGYGPQDLDDGESALYAKGAAEVRCKNNDDVVVNGGTQKVAREGDTVAAATAHGAASMATWISSVTTFINGLVPGTLTPPLDFGAIDSGADHFKG